MDEKAIASGSKAGEALGTTDRIWETYESYLSHHLIQGHTEDTLKFYAKELRLFLRDLDPSYELLGELTPQHVLDHLGSMKKRGLKQRTVCSRWQAINYLAQLVR